MNSVYLSKSKYCRAKQCNKMLWMDTYKIEEKISTANDAVLKNGTAVGEIAKRIFGEYIDIEFNRDLTKMIFDTEEALEQKSKIINEPDQNIGMYCMKPYKCEYWEYCTRNLPKPNVFDTYGNKTISTI